MLVLVIILAVWVVVLVGYSIAMTLHFSKKLKEAEERAKDFHKLWEHNMLKNLELNLVANWLYEVAWGARYDLDRDAIEANVYCTAYKELKDCHDIKENFDEWIKDN